MRKLWLSLSAGTRAALIIVGVVLAVIVTFSVIALFKDTLYDVILTGVLITMTGLLSYCAYLAFKLIWADVTRWIIRRDRERNHKELDS